MRKGRFVVLTEGHAGADSAFCMGGEQLWLGKVEQRGPSTVQLLMYKPQRNAAGGALLHALCMLCSTAEAHIGAACVQCLGVFRSCEKTWVVCYRCRFSPEDTAVL